MRVESPQDYEIDFVDDAYENIRRSETLKRIPTANQMEMLVGRYRSEFNIILVNGGKRLAAVQLVDKEVLPGGRRLCEPHSFTKAEYRGNRYAEQIYRWVLDEGIVLRSCGRQTLASQTLWMKLGMSYYIRAFNTRAGEYCDISRVDEYDVVLELSNTNEFGT